MKIKYVGTEKEKSVETMDGEKRVYTFTLPDKEHPKRPVVTTIDISDPILCEHLCKKCGGRFKKVGASPKVSQPAPAKK